MCENDFPGPNKLLSKISLGPSSTLPEVTVCAAVSAFFQSIVSSREIATSPVVEPSFSLCQKYLEFGLAAPVGIFTSYVL